MALSNKDWDYFVKDKVPKKEVEEDLKKLLDESKDYKIDKAITNLVDENKQEWEIQKKLKSMVSKEYKDKNQEEVDKILELKKLKASILKEKKIVSKKKKEIHNKKKKRKSLNEYCSRNYTSIHIHWRKDDIYLSPTRLKEIAEKEYNMQKSVFIQFVVRDWLIKDGKLPKEAMDYYMKEKRQRQAKKDYYFNKKGLEQQLNKNG